MYCLQFVNHVMMFNSYYRLILCSGIGLSANRLHLGLHNYANTVLCNLFTSP